MRNIKTQTSVTIIDCDEYHCKRCSSVKTFEYPWPVQVINEKQTTLIIKYCERFSRWAQTPENKILLPEPLIVDKDNKCLRCDKCIELDIILKEDKHD